MSKSTRSASNGQAAQPAASKPRRTRKPTPQPVAETNGHTFKPIYSGSPIKPPITADRVPVEEVDWFLKPYLPCGQLVMLSGNPGTGKSTFLAAIAAQVSGGPPIEGKSRDRAAAKVLLYGTEQQAGSMTRPKLEAAQAYLKNVHFGDIADDHSKQPRLALPDELDRLEEVVRSCRAQAVIFDPVTSYLADRISVKDGQHVREILDGLAAIAARQGCLIIATMHYRKSKDGTALHRLSGHAAWGEVPQTVIGLDVIHDPDKRRVLSLTKHNLTADGTSRLFTVEDVGGHPVFRLGPPTSVSAEDLLSDIDTPHDRNALADCIALWKRELDQNSIETVVMQAVAKNEGLSWSTMRRAYTKLGLKARREGFGKNGKTWIDKPKNGWLE
jgi:hypothetical protein